MLNDRKGVFVSGYTISRESIVKDKEYPVTVHGAFQYQDGDEAGILILVELEDGRLIEAGPSQVTMIKEETENE